MKNTDNISVTMKQREAYKNRVDSISEEEIAWFSGWLCADGCIRTDKTSGGIRFVICDKDPLDGFSALFGNKVSPPQKPSGLGKKPRYEWGIRGWKAGYILIRCKKWMSERYSERADRAIDMVFRPRKEKVLSVADVTKIKKALNAGYHGVGRDLAVEFGVSVGMISAIKHGRSWSYIEA